MSFLTTDQAAERLGVSTRRVAQLVNSAHLDAHRVRRSLLVSEASVIARERLAHESGRPISSGTARALIDALTSGSTLTARQATILRGRESEQLAATIARATHVSTFRTSNPAWAEPHLSLTGQHELGRIVESSAENLAGAPIGLHGYLRDLSLDDLIDEARLVNTAGRVGDSLTGEPDRLVHVHRFSDGEFPWREAPAALVAVDAARSEWTRVRAAGIDALERMRTRWLG